MNEPNFADIPIIDAHVHMSMPCTIPESEEHFREVMELRGYERMVFQAYTENPEKVNPLANTEALYYKLRFPGCYACGSLLHCHDERDTARGYAVQAEKLWDMGFDGMKMLEGKPAVRRALGHRLDDEIFDLYYAFLEENRIPLTMHLADPSYFWDADRVTPEIIRRGWFCGDGTYPSYDDFYDEIFGVLEKFPRLSLTLAHFGFMSRHPERAQRFMGYENTMLDLTPGGEMFVGFSQDTEYWRDFFLTHRRRILFGTDTYNDSQREFTYGNASGRCRLVRSFLEYSEPFAWPTLTGPRPDGLLYPLGLPRDVLRDIYRENALRRYGETPRRVLP